MTRTVAAGMFVALATTASGVAAQSPAHTAVPVTAPAPKAPAMPVEAADAKAPAIPAAQGYTYTAEGRRDPFVTLIRRGADTSQTTVAARAAGLAGLSAREVTLRGILASQGAYVAMLFGADDKTYIVRSGDKLSDGTIREITADAMVIEQQVHDPLSRQQSREIRKMLRQTEATN